MKRINWAKRITVLMAAVCVALAALSGTAPRPDLTTMLQVEGVPIYRDTYCYLLSEALRDTPRDKDGRPLDMQALREDIVRRCVAIVAVNSELYNREKSIYPQTKAQVAQRAAYAWRTYHAYYASIGVNKQTINSIFTARAAREQLFWALYDRGGSYEVPEEEIEGYFYSNYAAYNGVRVFLTTDNEDGTERALTKAETENLRSTLKQLVDEVNDGADFLEAAVSDAYAQALRYAAPMDNMVQKGGASVTDKEFGAVRALATDKAALLEFPAYFLVARGIDMKEQTEEYDRTEEYYRGYRGACLWALRGEAYEEALEELYKSFRADENIAAVERLLANWVWQPVEIEVPREEETETEEDTTEETTTAAETTTEPSS